MSAIANLSSTPAGLAPVNVHPHGHRKGLHMDPATDSSTDTAAQIPAGTAQNLFGSVLQSLEQVIGVQLTPPTAATPAATSATAAGTPAASTASTATPTSVSTLLQNYLNNVRNLQGNGSPTATLAGSNVSVSA